MTEPFQMTHDWTPPVRHQIETAALSLWLDGREDDARAVLTAFTGIGVAEFLAKVNGFRGAVKDLNNAWLAELTEG